MNVIQENYSLVSVVIATYNGEKFIETQLESLFDQTYPNIEIIVIDDGSTDNTISIVNKFASQHTNIRVFKNENNLGFVKNFEKGCGLCKGDFIALCDQDDYWHKDKVKRLVEEIGDCPMIYCNSVLCNEDLQSIEINISDRVICQSFNSCLQQAIFCRIYGNTILFKKSLYKSAIPFLTAIPHDWWLSYIATLHGGIKYLPELLVYYRQHSANIYGAVGGKRKKGNLKNISKKKALEEIRTRIHAFYTICPNEMAKEKRILHILFKGYQNFSLINNIRRVYIFLRYHKLLLAVKKHSTLHRYLFCLKMFVKIK